MVLRPQSWSLRSWQPTPFYPGTVELESSVLATDALLPWDRRAGVFGPGNRRPSTLGRRAGVFGPGNRRPSALGP
ncbi:hypothetical protein NDU88_002050 [Pleurodeles waltl]|uniref:Uncharacterized protein n=1 Tax=Pleurodeles waltl TaxID=8319 RepID=A0AAV7KSH0_PLEWA|nr:hypothetical protein NDU88_002050 [Pleurodeles waltl]